MPSGHFVMYILSRFKQSCISSWRGVLSNTTLCNKVSDLQQVGGFLWVLWFPPPIKPDSRYNRNIVGSGVKHHNFNPVLVQFIYSPNLIKYVAFNITWKGVCHFSQTPPTFRNKNDVSIMKVIQVKMDVNSKHTTAYLSVNYWPPLHKSFQTNWYKINVREYRWGYQKWTMSIQRNWQHRVHKMSTKENKQ